MIHAVKFLTFLLPFVGAFLCIGLGAEMFSTDTGWGIVTGFGVIGLLGATLNGHIVISNWH